MQGDTSVTIVNRGLQRIGAVRIVSFSDSSKNAKEASALYDNVRRAELRRNVWRFSIRRTAIRPVGTPLQAWAPTTTYSSGDLVSYGTSTTTGNPVNYKSLAGSNLGNEPDTSPSDWQLFYGNTMLAITFPAYAPGTTYAQGAVVLASDGNLYLALQGSTGVDPTNQDSNSTTWTMYFGPTTASAYDPTSAYFVGEIVFYNHAQGTLYVSTINNNANDPVVSGAGWLALTGATASPIVVPWPAGTGPQVESTTNNVYVLPAGYLREAPQNPKQGSQSFLGAPSNAMYDDWIFEGNYLVTRYGTPIVFRFAANVRDPLSFDSLFCEGLSCRVAMELSEILTQSQAKLTAVSQEYAKFMTEARLVNGIETSPTEAPLDDWIATRI